ncbi:MAG TPA: glycosyltransferase family 2 protein [Acidimicrobiales bacterium]|nr:glycosyltransferase family 2 protein [Acidimicrobiales bacterium]
MSTTLSSRLRQRLKAGTEPLTVQRSLEEDAGAPRVVEEAIAAFHERYGSEALAPLVIVIAALNEEGSLGQLLEEIPDTIAGLRTSVLVVDDGSTDRTSEVAEQGGALVCALSRNCGHGVALRAGYRLAKESGGRYIATLDADGQWDPADLPAMVQLLEDGRADFVIGSRQLGRTENTDAVRNLGVRFFSLLISALTATRVTDTSSGLRAMRVEVTDTVRQTQPQYQTSELLIGAIFQGFRVAEVPTVMRVRTAGESRKGRNGFYALRYATVIYRTFRREWPDRVKGRRAA